MDKNIIKNHLKSTFVNEETKAPGLKATEKVQKESGKTNKAAMKAVESEMTKYDKAPKTKDDIEPVKYENDKDQQEIHDLGEIENGVNMLEPDNTPSKEWEERQKKSMEGDSTMGNKGGEEGSNTEPTWDASSKDFGKEKYENGEKVMKKRKEANKAADARLGISTDSDTNDKYLKEDVSEEVSEEIDEDVNEDEVSEDANSILHKTATKGMAPDELFHGDMYKEGVEKKKKLTFNEAFNGVTNALAKIPNKFKVDKKEFQMTDGNENYEIRWEGSLNEGRAIILQASDKTLMSEDMQHMKHLMGYKSEETLGTLKGEARINENASFKTIWDKTQNLINENEDKKNI